MSAGAFLTSLMWAAAASSLSFNTLVALSPAPAFPTLVFEALEAFEAGKNGGQEEDGDEEDEDILDKEERLDFEEAAKLSCLAGLAGGVIPGSSKLRQRLCWLGEQLRHRLSDRAQTQNLHAPELLQPQHFGISDDYSFP